MTATLDQASDLEKLLLEGVEMGITTFDAEFSQFADAEALIGPGTVAE